MLTVRFFFVFFFYLGFLSRTFTIHGTAGKGEGIYLLPVYHFHPLHRHLDITRAITAESSPLHIAYSTLACYYAKIDHTGHAVVWNFYHSRVWDIMTELNIYFIISTQTIQVNNADTTKLLHCHYCWFTTKFWGFFFIALRISYFGKDNLTL